MGNMRIRSNLAVFALIQGQAAQQKHVHAGCATARVTVTERAPSLHSMSSAETIKRAWTWGGALERG